MPSIPLQIFGPVVSEMCTKMNRMKKFEGDTIDTPLQPRFTTFDMTLLGVGHMVGAGLYVVNGTVARYTAGPGVILSILIAGFASLLSALCYAEFVARTPKARSAYVYAYAAISEFWAFFIGWSVILEHMIGAASVARAWSGYADSLVDYFFSTMKILVIFLIRADRIIDTWGFKELPDLMAAGLIISCAFFLACGFKISATVNSILTVVNLAVMALVIVLGFNYDNPENWCEENGGFLPLGMGGVLAGAATCFYAFIGFDSIATSGEKAKDPGKSIPLATGFSTSIVTVGYVLVSGTLTLMVPYAKIDPIAALPQAFASNGVSWAEYVISIGALCGMTTTLLGSLISSSRMMYAMASDGLLFSFMGHADESGEVPFITLVITGGLSALVAISFDLQSLVEFMLIGASLAYMIIATSVIVLRYRPESVALSIPQSDARMPSDITSPPTQGTDSNSDHNIIHSPGQSELRDHVEQTGRLRRRSAWLAHVIGNWESGTAVVTALIIYTASCVGFNLLAFFGPPEWWIWALEVYFVIAMCACLVTIEEHQQCPPTGKFRVPLMPLVPAITVFLNVSLMCHLSLMSWIRFLIWMLIGMFVYFSYGIHHSTEASGGSSHSVLTT